MLSRNWMLAVFAPDDGPNGGAPAEPAGANGPAGFDDFQALLDGSTGANWGEVPPSQAVGTSNRPEGSAAPGTPAPAGESAPQEPAPPAPVGQPPAQPAPSEAARGPGEVEQLRSQLAQLQGYVQAIAQQRQAPPTATPSSEPQARSRRYGFSIPPQMVEAIKSDDPMQTAAGLGVLLNDLSERLHDSILADVQQQMQQRWAPAVQQQVATQQELRSTAQTIAGDFYGSYPELDREEVKPVVSLVTKRVINEMGQRGQWSGWNAQVRDAIGQKVRETLASMAALQSNAQQNYRPPVGGPGPQAPRLSPNGARPAGAQPTGAPPNPNSPEAIASLLGDFA